MLATPKLTPVQPVQAGTITTTYNITMSSMATLRAMNFAATSRKVVGANWTGRLASTPAPTAPPNWLPFEVWLTRRYRYDAEDPDAGWQTVPSARVLRKRAKAAERRRAREAGFNVEALRVASSGMAYATDMERMGWLGSA